MNINEPRRHKPSRRINLALALDCQVGPHCRNPTVGDSHVGFEGFGAGAVDDGAVADNQVGHFLGMFRAWGCLREGMKEGRCEGTGTQ